MLYEGGQDERVNPEYTRWRRFVFNRDGRRCRRCFTTEDIQAHHIKRFATHPDVRWNVDNGITLCKDCHKLFRGVEEQYEAPLTMMAITPHYFCETEQDFYNALRNASPCC